MTDPSPSDFLDRLIGRSATAAGRLVVRSALNPMLWLSAIVSPAAFIGAYFTHDPLATILAIVGVLPVASTCIGFFYFMIFHPENLKSEDYQIRHEAIELIREKGKNFAVNPSSLEAIANPHYRAIGSGERR